MRNRYFVVKEGEMRWSVLGKSKKTFIGLA
jgi:hypothetical protein